MTDQPQPAAALSDTDGQVIPELLHLKEATDDDMLAMGRCPNCGYPLRRLAAAAPPSGQVVVDENALCTLVSELIYQQGQLNQSESIGKATGIVRRLAGNGASE